MVELHSGSVGGFLDAGMEKTPKLTQKFGHEHNTVWRWPLISAGAAD